MHSKYCPKCKTIKNLRTSVTIKRTKKGGKVKNILITSYHCEECNSFIKSDEILNDGLDTGD